MRYHRFCPLSIVLLLLAATTPRPVTAATNPPPPSRAIALTPDGQTLLAVNPDSNTVTFLDTATEDIITEVSVGRDPRTVAIAAGRAYVANRGSRSVSVVDIGLRQTVAELQLGHRPYGVVANPVKGRVYVSLQGEDRVGAYAGYIATAPSEKGFYMVLVVGSGGKQADLYETILRPVVEAFTTDGTLPPSDAETDGGEIKLVPYTSDDFGISGLVPEGWTEVTPGTFARGSSATDQTALIQKSFPGLTIEQLKPQLLPVLRIEELPEPVGTYESEALTWALYAVEIEAPGLGTFVVDVALAETEDGTFIILFQALKEDHDALHEAIFLPAVDALAPVGE